MNIQDALKETGKAGVISTEKTYTYAKLNEEGSLFWYDKTTQAKDVAVAVSVIGKDIWQPYHEEKEIRPEEVKEIWNSPSNAMFIVERYNGILYFATPSSSCKGEAITHKCSEVWNNNGWTRLYSPVEEDVERIEIEGVDWYSQGNGPVIFYPTENGSTFFLNHAGLVNKPPMKMILEIPKDKHES